MTVKLQEGNHCCMIGEDSKIQFVGEPLERQPLPSESSKYQSGSQMVSNDDLFYSRSPDYRYPLQSHPDRWIITSVTEEFQCLIGYAYQHCVLLEFDSDGNLTHVVSTYSPELQPLAYNLQTEVLELADIVLNKLGVQLTPDAEIGRTVYLKRFHVIPLGISITDFSSPESKAWMIEDGDHDSWISDGNYYLFWNKCYGVDSSGRITSS